MRNSHRSAKLFPLKDPSRSEVRGASSRLCKCDCRRRGRFPVSLRRSCRKIEYCMEDPRVLRRLDKKILEGKIDWVPHMWQGRGNSLTGHWWQGGSYLNGGPGLPPLTMHRTGSVPRSGFASFLLLEVGECSCVEGPLLNDLKTFGDLIWRGGPLSVGENTTCKWKLNFQHSLLTPQHQILLLRPHLKPMGRSEKFWLHLPGVSLHSFVFICTFMWDSLLDCVWEIYCC